MKKVFLVTFVVTLIFATTLHVNAVSIQEQVSKAE